MTKLVEEKMEGGLCGSRGREDGDDAEEVDRPLEKYGRRAV